MKTSKKWRKPLFRQPDISNGFFEICPALLPFSDAAHERAWLIRVTINACKDLRKSFFRSRTLPLEAIGEQAADIPPDHREVLEAVLSLPQKYRDVIYLHYYEDYTAPQISKILGKNTNTVYTLLTRSKALLKEKLGGEA